MYEPLAIGWIVPLSFYKDGLSIKKHPKVDMPLNKETVNSYSFK